jgi:hypothetical protein
VSHKLCDEIEDLQSKLEEEVERNGDSKYAAKQKVLAASLDGDVRAIDTNIAVAVARKTDLENRRVMLLDQIKTLVVEKRAIDKKNFELDQKLQGKDLTDDQLKQKQKNEERKMRIKYEKSVLNLRSLGVQMMEKIAKEELKSKDILETKLKLEQSLLDLKEDVKKADETFNNNREELIKLKVKNSQLDALTTQLTEEDSTF